MALWRDHAVAERQSAEISRSHLGGRDELSGRNEPWSARRDEGDAITARGALLASHADMKMADAIPAAAAASRWRRRSPRRIWISWPFALNVGPDGG
jgi:hypothetical protein